MADEAVPLCGSNEDGKMEKKELRETRKQMMDQMEQRLYRTDKDARKLAAISVVAAGYGGDMDEELANELLDDMDFHYNKVKCRKIEQMLPKLMKMVEEEIKVTG